MYCTDVVLLLLSLSAIYFISQPDTNILKKEKPIPSHLLKYAEDSP